MLAPRTLKTVIPGSEDLAPGHNLERHRHLQPYAIVLIRGRFDQVGYAGRVRVHSGDLLVQFRAELRARAAWLRIVRTRDRLAEIAAAGGFSDQAHMTRAIRELTGASPAAWRRDPRIRGLCRA